MFSTLTIKDKDERMCNKVLNIIQEKDFINILIIVTIAFLFVVSCFLVIRKLTKRKKNKDKSTSDVQTPIVESNNINPSAQYVYNPLKDTQQQTTSNPNKNKNKKEKKVRKSKKQIAFDTEKELCIQGYNNLVNIYSKSGYPTDINTNDILAYYYSQIINATDLEELKNIGTNLSFQTQSILAEIEKAQTKKYDEERKKVLYDECIENIVELEKIFDLANVDGKALLQEFNTRILGNSKFNSVDEYEKILNELKYNISYIKEKYKSILNDQISNNGKDIDLTLVHSLKLLNCSVNETDMKVIKRNYLDLLKKNHPDLNHDSYSSIEMTSQLNAAYKYIENNLNN